MSERRRAPEPTADRRPGIERFREFLLMLARLQLDRRLHGKLDASDIVQQTMLRAHQGLHGFRGRDDAELAAWLRQVLATTMADELRRFTASKRNIGLERALLASFDESTARLGAWLATDTTSPSQHLVRHEQTIRLAAALATLPDDQRRAIELHHLMGCSLDDVGRQMGRSKASVAGLLRRGLQGLRTAMGAENPS